MAESPEGILRVPTRGQVRHNMLKINNNDLSLYLSQFL